MFTFSAHAITKYEQKKNKSQPTIWRVVWSTFIPNIYKVGFFPRFDFCRHFGFFLFLSLLLLCVVAWLLKIREMKCLRLKIRIVCTEMFCFVFFFISRRVYNPIFQQRRMDCIFFFWVLVYCRKLANFAISSLRSNRNIF